MSPVIDLAEARADRDVPDDLAAALAAAPDIETPPEPDPEPVSPLEAQWLRFRDQFADAMEGGLYTIGDLEQMIADGRAYFWPGRAAAVITERVAYPSGEAVMQSIWGVGDLAEILELTPGIEAAARLVGCSRMLIEGRAGWARVLKGRGYEPWSTTVSKVL